MRVATRHPGDLSPWNTLVAVCAPEAASRDLSRWLHAAVRAAFPATDAQSYEVKAATLLNRRQFEHSAERRRLVEDVTGLIGNDHSRRQQAKAWRGPRPPEQLLSLTSKVASRM